jgi:hypothetical protein
MEEAAREILAQVELASGLGLIRDAVTVANDTSASLSQKVALFGASAVMTLQDRERLEGLLQAVHSQLNAQTTPARTAELAASALPADQDAVETLRPFAAAIPSRP